MADDHDDDKKGGPAYKVSDKVSMDKILAQDEADESLRKYKASLGLTTNVYSRKEFCSKILLLCLINYNHALAKDDPRRVVILELRVITENRPGGDIVYNLKDKDAVKKMKDTPFTLKEAANYKIKVTFRVQHEIVSGLKYANMVYRKGIRGMCFFRF